MRNLFNLENPIMQQLSRLADLMIVNILFVLCCLPIVTIGASYTALCSVVFKMVRKEDTRICADFFHAFAANFTQSTLMWLVIAGIGVILAVNVRFAFSASGAAGAVLRIVTSAACVLFYMVAQYLSPYVARFQDRTGTVVKNCILIALAHLPATIFCCIITVATAAVSILNEQVLGFALFFWPVMGFACLTYINLGLFRRVFAAYEPSQPEDETVALEEAGSDG